MAEEQSEARQPAGVAIDSMGGVAADPTKNVLDLAHAGSTYQDAMRDAESRIAKLRSKLEIQRLGELAKAESRRVDDLAALRYQYDTRIAEDLKVGVKTTSEQLASQLIKETGSLSNLIGALRTELTSQNTALTNSFTNQLTSGISALTPRIADLERFRWESGGKTSISDPQTASALKTLGDGINTMQDVFSRSIIKMTDTNAEAIKQLAGSLQKVERSERDVSSRGMGRGEIVSYITMGILVLSQIVTMLVVFIPHTH